MEYIPLPEVTKQLHSKTLVMIIGPTAIGKSTLMNEVIECDSQFKRVSGFTTRQPRPNDEPGMYRYLSVEQANALIKAKCLVQYAIFPTTGMLYGTEPEDYPGTYNMLDMLSGAVESALTLPFERHIVISLTASEDTWLTWFKTRYPTINDEAIKRLQEAEQSIEWSLSQGASHQWLVNIAGNLTQTAHKLIEISKQTPCESSVPSEAKRLLESVRRLLSYS